MIDEPERPTCAMALEFSSKVCEADRLRRVNEVFSPGAAQGTLEEVAGAGSGCGADAPAGAETSREANLPAAESLHRIDEVHQHSSHRIHGHPACSLICQTKTTANCHDRCKAIIAEPTAEPLGDVQDRARQSLTVAVHFIVVADKKTFSP